MRNIDWMLCQKCGNMEFEVGSTVEGDLFLFTCSNPRCRASHLVQGHHVASYDKPPLDESDNKGKQE